MFPRIVIVLVALATSVASVLGPGGEDAPEPDDCSGGETDGVTALELGAPDDSAFMPWSDGDAIALVSGDQGLDMLPLRVRLTGPDVPACVELEFSADYPDPNAPESGGRESASRRWSLATYEDGYGRSIKTHYLILPVQPLPATEMRIVVRAGTVQVTRTVWVEFSPGDELDAGSDAGADAGAVDAMPDAMPADAGDDDGGPL